MKTSAKLLFIAYLFGLSIPFCITLFLGRNGDFFGLLLLYFIAVLPLGFLADYLRRSDPKLSRKKYYILLLFSAFAVFIVTFKFQLDIAEQLYFQRNSTKLENFAHEIIRYGKITEMTNGRDHYNSINQILVESDSLNINVVDNIFFLNDILQKQGIDNLKYEYFQNMLIDLGFQDYFISEDGIIFFTRGGLIDNCYGLAYSVNGTQPLNNNCGKIIGWVNIMGNWYSWTTT